MTNGGSYLLFSTKKKKGSVKPCYERNENMKQNNMAGNKDKHGCGHSKMEIGDEGQMF